jgi:hypothetical protein
MHPHIGWNGNNKGSRSSKEDIKALNVTYNNAVQSVSDSAVDNSNNDSKHINNNGDNDSQRANNVLHDTGNSYTNTSQPKTNTRVDSSRNSIRDPNLRADMCDALYSKNGIFSIFI